jgi:hypothetical protein
MFISDMELGGCCTSNAGRQLILPLFRHDARSPLGPALGTPRLAMLAARDQTLSWHIDIAIVAAWQANEMGLNPVRDQSNAAQAQRFQDGTHLGPAELWR